MELAKQEVKGKEKLIFPSSIQLLFLYYLPFFFSLP